MKQMTNGQIFYNVKDLEKIMKGQVSLGAYGIFVTHYYDEAQINEIIKCLYGD